MQWENKTAGDSLRDDATLATFNTILNIRKVKWPVLEMHAFDDSLVPISHADSIYCNCNSPKVQFYVQDSNHNFFDTASEIWLRAKEFLNFDKPRNAARDTILE
uniref:Hydrolase_4 domain-containing protein n=1 Tax=Rhabditophanes sp. KR3021 TaxID=114890 RepID=A0AC35U1D3_9BILA